MAFNSKLASDSDSDSDAASDLNLDLDDSCASNSVASLESNNEPDNRMLLA